MLELLLLVLSHFRWQQQRRSQLERQPARPVDGLTQCLARPRDPLRDPLQVTGVPTVRIRVRGTARVDADFRLLASAVNLARLAVLGLRGTTHGWVLVT